MSKALESEEAASVNRVFVDALGQKDQSFVEGLCSCDALNTLTDTTVSSLVSYNATFSGTDISLRPQSAGSLVGGVNFTTEPKIEADETVVAISIRYHVRFAESMLWNLGGYLPGVYGHYTNIDSSTARALDEFECKWRWDARGKLGLMRKQATDDPNEWRSTVESKVAISRGQWYELGLFVHIDGRVVATVDGEIVYDGTCGRGLEKIQGVKMSAYCVDSTAVEHLAISVKDLYIAAQINTER